LLFGALEAGCVEILNLPYIGYSVGEELFVLIISL